jgi:hypothetical protein
MNYNTSRFALVMAGLALCVGALLLARNALDTRERAVGGGGEADTGGTAALGTSTDRYAPGGGQGGPVSDVGGGREITRLEEIAQAEPQTALVGRVVNLPQVPVQRVLGDRYILVGANENQRVLVRLDAPQPALKPGARIDVFGTIAQHGKEMWEQVSPESESVLKQHSVFINAAEIRVR